MKWHWERRRSGAWDRLATGREVATIGMGKGRLLRVNWTDSSYWIHGLRAAKSAVVPGAILLLLIPAEGCVSKHKAEVQAQAAYVAGQRQAMEMFRQTQLRGPSVTIAGAVQNSIIPWTPDLTLAKALVAADYRGTTDPREVIVARQGKATSYDPKQLLSGEDVPLQPNDVVQIR